LLLEGKTMIQRVYEQCKKSASLGAVLVATDDERIEKKLVELGIDYLMTDKNHQNGTSRCAEVLEKINENPRTERNFNYVINIQGDEPLINPIQIDELAALFKDNNIPIATQVKKETDLSLLNNQDIVKAILDENNFVIDFKRIISEQEQLKTIKERGFFYRHIGIYGFKSNMLQKLVKLAPSENEVLLHLEQMRWLDNGFKIKAGITAQESLSIDRLEDVPKVIEKIKRCQPLY
jgi:3-deoxy-manno-octulosonate cytidylyltransferase (CMP-KDO synthetase)